MVNAIANASISLDGDSVKVSPEIKTVDNSYTLEITTKYLNDYIPEDGSLKTSSELVDDAMTNAFASLGYVDSEKSEPVKQFAVTD